MPTGYTCPIEDNPDFTFPQYLWRCARAFGALISMRDDPLDAPIPDAFQPSSYDLDRLKEAREELAALDRMTAAEVVRRIQSEREEVERENREYREKHAVKVARYAAMRAQVEAWGPPTPDHVTLKRFMLEQIDSSVRFDGSCYQEDLPPSNPDEWLANRRASLAKDLKYHQEGHDKEVARTNDRNEWIRKLRASVPISGRPAGAGEPDGQGAGSWRDRGPLL